MMGKPMNIDLYSGIKTQIKKIMKSIMRLYIAGAIQNMA